MRARPELVRTARKSQDQVDTTAHHGRRTPLLQGRRVVLFSASSLALHKANATGKSRQIRSITSSKCGLEGRLDTSAWWLCQNRECILTRSSRHRSVTLDSGEIPYILDGANCSTAECSGIVPSVGGPWPYDTMSYATEGIAAVALRFPDRRETLIRQWKPSVDFLLRTQNLDGYWGKLGGSDLMRSPRCLTLLSWWLSAVETKSYHDIPTRDAVSR